MNLSQTKQLTINVFIYIYKKGFILDYLKANIFTCIIKTSLNDCHNDPMMHDVTKYYTPNYLISIYNHYNLTSNCVPKTIIYNEVL